jgi:hypothetical protein
MATFPLDRQVDPKRTDSSEMGGSVRTPRELLVRSSKRVGGSVGGSRFIVLVQERRLTVNTIPDVMYTAVGRLSSA